MATKIRFVFIFGTVLSFLLITNCVGQMIASLESSYITKKASLASEMLAKLKRESNETFAIQKELNYFYGLLAEEKCSLTDLENHCKSLTDAGYNFVNLRFFDKYQNLLNIRNYRKDNLLDPAMRRLYSALADYKTKNDETKLKRYNSLFETMIGAINPCNLAKQTSTLVPISLGGKPSYLYWNMYEDQKEENIVNGMLVWVKKSDVPSRFFCQKLIDRLNLDSANNEGHQVFGFVDINQLGYVYPENLSSFIHLFNASELVSKISELKAALKEKEIINDYLFNYVEFEDGKFFFCLTEIIDHALVKAVTITFTVVFFIATAFFCAYGYFFLKKVAVEEAPFKELVSKVYFSALTTSAIFITSLVLINFFISSFSASTRKELILSNLTSITDWLDESYNMAKKELRVKWLDMIAENDFKALNLRGTEQRVKAMSSSGKLDRLYITSKNGDMIYSYPQEPTDNVFNRIIPIIARKIAIERFGSEESWKNRLDSLMMDSVSKSFTELIGEGARDLLKAFESQDSATELEFGNKRHLVFSATLEGNKGPLIVIFWLDANRFSRDYIIEKIKDSESLPKNLRETILAMVPIHLDNLPYPPEIAKYSFAREVTERVSQSRRPIEFETKAGGQTFYGVGALLPSAPEYVVFALHGD